MKRMSIFLPIGVLATMLAVHTDILAERKPIGLYACRDSVWHEHPDDEHHERKRNPFRVFEPPHVEYDSETSMLRVETASDQTVTYYIKDEAGAVVQKGELLLRAGQETIVYLYITPADDTHNIYIRSNGIVYVGEL